MLDKFLYLRSIVKGGGTDIAGTGVVITGEAAAIEGYDFLNNPAITAVDLPLAETIGSDAFYGCRALTRVALPAVRNMGGFAFGHCVALTTVDFPSLTVVANNAFYGSEALTTLILRSRVMCDMDISAIVRTGIITNQGMPTGMGFVYVPAVLYESYIADWIPKIIALATSQNIPIDQPTATYIATAVLRKLEDYTVDGSVNGPLDETKI